MEKCSLYFKMLFKLGTRWFFFMNCSLKDSFGKPKWFFYSTAVKKQKNKNIFELLFLRKQPELEMYLQLLWGFLVFLIVFMAYSSALTCILSCPGLIVDKCVMTKALLSWLRLRPFWHILLERSESLVGLNFQVV